MNRLDGDEAERPGHGDDVKDGSGFPEPSLVVLVGASSAGKSTWAAATFKENEIVSLAALQAAVGIDDHDVRAIPDALGLLNRIVSTRIDRGLLVVVDSDGLDSSRRISWATGALSKSIPAFAVLFVTDLQTCLGRNEQRSHPLPEGVIRRQLLRSLEIGPDLEREGFEVFVFPTPLPETEDEGLDTDAF